MLSHTRASKSHRKCCHLRPAYHLLIQGLEIRYPSLLYLWVLEAGDVRIQVEFDAFSSTWQGQSTDQQHQKHGKRESGSEVDNLQGQEGVRCVLATVRCRYSLLSKAGGHTGTMKTHWPHLL